MANDKVETLNSLLRGEVSATETYEQVLNKLGTTAAGPELRRIHAEHRDAVNLLKDHVVRHGGRADEDSGAWGIFAQAVESTAQIFGNDAALKALKEGEEHGIKVYEEAISRRNLPLDCSQLIETKLLPQVRAHIPVLDRLMAASL